jgi:quinol-cytochrome oxidoreductase complex cytochrome b subunit
VVKFYGWHIFGLTLGIVILGAWHIFRVRRDGGIAVPPPEQRLSPERTSRDALVRREALAALIVSVLLILLAVFSPAPIASPIAQNSLPDAPARAPWFFLWVQQLIRLGNPFVLGILIPLLVLFVLVMLPLIAPVRPDELGQWFPRSGRTSQVITAVIGLSIVFLTVLALANQ